MIFVEIDVNTKSYNHFPCSQMIFMADLCSARVVIGSQTNPRARAESTTISPYHVHERKCETIKRARVAIE